MCIHICIYKFAPIKLISINIYICTYIVCITKKYLFKIYLHKIIIPTYHLSWEKKTSGDSHAKKNQNSSATRVWTLSDFF